MSRLHSGRTGPGSCSIASARPSSSRAGCDRPRTKIRAVALLADRFHFVITPYYASLMDPDDPECPIRRQVVPRTAELNDPAGLADPLREVEHSPVKNVIRAYPDRIAFCVNNDCALYCRFCLRKRMVGDEEWAMKKRELEQGLAWIEDTPGDSRRAAHGRGSAHFLGRSPRMADRAASRDPACGDRATWHAAARHLALPRDPGPLSHAGALSPDLGQHPLQSSDGADGGGGQGVRSPAPGRSAGRKPERVPARHQRRRRHHEAAV